MATQYTQDIGHASDNDYQPRYISSRSSSSSSSGSQPGRITALSQSHTPSRSPVSSPNLSNGGTDILASQSEMQSYPPTQKDIPLYLKGKQRASVPMDRPSSMNGGEERTYRSTWMVDEEKGQLGADAWVERDRVILVLGRE